MKLIDKDAVLAIIEKLKDEALEYGDKSRWFLVAALAKEINSLEVKEVNEEPVSNDLEEAANDYAHDLVHDDVFETFIDGALWQKEHLWKDAQGDDLPEIDKEVIALIEAFGHYKVIFAHRVDENAGIHTSIDGKPLVLHPKRYDKGGWNTPDLKFWLDCELPKMEE